MAGSVNKVILIGNLGRDPEVRSFQSGDKVCNFSIATEESWKDKTSGERKSRTEWHKITIYNQGIVKVCEDYLKKGAKVYIEGQLETRKWTDKDGVERYTTEVAVRNFRGSMTMLSSKDSGGRGTRDDDGNQDSEPENRASQRQAQAPIDEYDDEIPFN